jgi:hypothetical protein
MPKYEIKQIYNLESAIEEKYGKEALVDPSENWTTEKETVYLEQLKIVDKLYRETSEANEVLKTNGFLINKNLLGIINFKTCPSCGSQICKSNDDVYMTKFSCCFRCYVNNIEGKLNK